MVVRDKFDAELALRSGRPSFANRHLMNAVFGAALRGGCGHSDDDIITIHPNVSCC